MFYTNVTTQIIGGVKDGSATTKSLIQSTTFLLQNIDPTYKACLWTADETGDALYKYGFNLDEP
jgi:hypothetical protein